MEDIYKIVNYDEFCETCTHKDLAEDKDPCDECLNNPVNLYSHKPINYKKDGD